jgi:hypothetical protein
MPVYVGFQAHRITNLVPEEGRVENAISWQSGPVRFSAYVLQECHDETT